MYISGPVCTPFLIKTVESLVEQVPYIDWVGIYMYENVNHNLVAASNFEDDLRWESNGELKFPISNQQRRNRNDDRSQPSADCV